MAKSRRRTKRPRTAAQRAATRKMIAARLRMLRARRRTSRSPKGKRAHPITPARVASRAGRQLRYRRPNPVGFFGDFVQGTLMPAAVGGAGALGLDVLLGVLPLPENLKTGPMRPVVRIAGAVALGALASTFTTRRTAEQIAAGALVVVLYDTMKGFIARSGIRVPGLSLYEIPGVGVYDVQQEVPAVGYTDSGIQVGDVSMQPDEVGAYVDEFQ